MKNSVHDNGGFIGRVADYAATDYYQITGSYSAYSFSSDSITFGVSSQEGATEDIFFKPDGTVLFMIGKVSDSVHSYTLSTAWDLSTASYTGDSLYVKAQTNIPTGVTFKPDGTKLYVSGQMTNSLSQYSLSTAWDITTASLDSDTNGVFSEEGSVRGVTFKPDGTKFYIVGSTGYVHEYSMTTAWDISTNSYSGDEVSTNGEVGGTYNTVTDIAFNSNGTIMYAVGLGNYFGSWDLSTAYDITTASFNSKFSVPSSTQGITFKDDYTKVYFIDSTNNVVSQYSASSTSINGNKKNTGVWSMDADYLNARTTQGYRYIKWHITDIKSMSASMTQISELYLKYNGSNISWGNATITNPGGNNPGSEQPSNLIDGIETNKVLDFNVDVDGGSIFIIDAGVGNLFNFDSYYYVTGNDTAARDPTSWTMEGSNDGTNYTVLHTVTNATITSSRRADTQTFTL